jgi:hypothetical protein
MIGGCCLYSTDSISEAEEFSISASQRAKSFSALSSLSGSPLNPDRSTKPLSIVSPSIFA